MLPITKRPQWCERRMSSPHLSVFRMQQRGVSGYLELWLGVICCWGVRHVVHDITCGGKFSIYLPMLILPPNRAGYEPGPCLDGR